MIAHWRDRTAVSLACGVVRSEIWGPCALPLREAIVRPGASSRGVLTSSARLLGVLEVEHFFRKHDRSVHAIVEIPQASLSGIREGGGEWRGAFSS